MFILKFNLRFFRQLFDQCPSPLDFFLNFVDRLGHVFEIIFIFGQNIFCEI